MATLSERLREWCEFQDPNYVDVRDVKIATGALDAMEAAMEKARQLANIATDWNLDEVEIDGEMVSTYNLRDEFDAALAMVRK